MDNLQNQEIPINPLSEADLADLGKRFTYHAPKGTQPGKYVTLREHGKALAELIMRYTPKSREQSLALTKLEESIFWANAAIARNE